jgi:hypothetical protein
VTALARLATLLAALACWRGRSRPVAVALVVAVVASWASTLAIHPRLAFALYLVPAAASVWLAMRAAAAGGEWAALLAWLTLAAWAWAAPPGSPWAAVRRVVAYEAVVVQLAALAVIGRPRTRIGTSVVVLAAGDVLALAVPLLGAAWWPAQGQCVIVSAALIWTHRTNLR